jgi:EmrB/QacA subfamily drug resistance transporter
VTILRASLRILAEEPARPGWVREHARAWQLAVATVCIGAFMGQLDASIVTVALPTIQRSFHESVSVVAWVGLAYLVALVATVAAFGRLSDLVGHKRIYLYGFVVFVVGSALCAVAPTIDALIAFRVLQGLGAAMLQANGVAIVALAVPRERLGRAIGVQGAAQALGLGAGPAVGGLLLALGGWRLLFLVNVPAGIAAFALGWFLLPRSRELHRGVRLDRTGLALLVPAIAVTLGVLTVGGGRAGGTDLLVLLALVAAVLVGAFCVHERRASAPLLDLAVLTDRTVASGVVGALCSYVVLFGVLLATPYFLERGLHLGVVASGATLAVMPIAMGVAAAVAGRLAERFGTRHLAMAGMAVSAAALAAAALLHGAAGALVVELAVLGTGIGLFTASNNTSVMRAVPRRSAGEASGLLNMGRGMGTAVGLAVTSLLLALGAPATPAAHARIFGLTAGVLALVALGGALAASLAAAPAASRPAAQPPEARRALTGTSRPDGVGRVTP